VLWRSTPTAHSIPHTRSIWRTMAVIKPLSRSVHVYYCEENNLSGRYGQCRGENILSSSGPDDRNFRTDITLPTVRSTVTQRRVGSQVYVR
jgi:hypothetical protein